MEKKEKKQSLNLYQRMQGVMKDVRYIQKKDKAAKGLPYKFISHDQVTGALHDAFVKHGILAPTDVIEFKQDGNKTIVSVMVTFTNVDNPKDQLAIKGFGYGIDNQDKGPGKAISYATKMVYLKCFMLETGEDPERSNKDYEPSFLSDEQIGEIDELMSKIEDFDVEKFYKWCQVKDIKELKSDKYNLIVRSLKNKIKTNGSK